MGGANYPILLIFSDLAANTLYVCILHCKYIDPNLDRRKAARVEQAPGRIVNQKFFFFN